MRFDFALRDVTGKNSHKHLEMQFQERGQPGLETDLKVATKKGVAKNKRGFLSVFYKYLSL